MPVATMELPTYVVTCSIICNVRLFKVQLSVSVQYLPYRLHLSVHAMKLISNLHKYDELILFKIYKPLSHHNYL